jgi:hypothetical protein
VVSGLVSEKTGCRQNLFQTFAAIETIEVTPDSGLPVIRGVKVAFDLGVIGQGAVNHTFRLSPKSGEFSRFEGLIKTCRSWGAGGQP